MSFARNNPWFTAGVTLCTLFACGELALICERVVAARMAARQLEERRGAWTDLIRLTPAPTPEIASALQADWESTQGALAAMELELNGRGPTAKLLRSARVPSARTDSYFDIATFVEKTRALAREREVEIRPEAARFGFAAFTHEGPVPDQIEPVFRQRQIMQYLVEALIDAGPRSIVAVRREQTAGRMEREAWATARANGEAPPEVGLEEGADTFIIDPRMSARVPGLIDTMAFQFVFTGQTAALRTLLNRLASFELPILVREVQVDTASGDETVSGPAAMEFAAPPGEPENPDAASIVLSVSTPADAVPARPPDSRAAHAARSSRAVPIISKPLSRFMVTLEFLERVPSAPPPTEEPPPESQTASLANS